MESNICPECGKPLAGTVSSFDCCPGHRTPRTDPGSPPQMEPTPNVGGESPVTPTSGFPREEHSLGTKLSSGTRVGEFQIQDRIGEGGMGTVYSAVHPIIGKKVAIKVLAGRLAKNKNAIRRFVLEARAVNDIRHPGLVDIFSFGRLTDGRHYYVMEFLAGRDLGDVLRERLSLPMSEAIPIFIEVGHALVAVHSKGIVHRDLKPENILLLSTPQPSGQRVKLVDFGLAKLVEGVQSPMREGAPHTAAGVNVGTPHYMSPEQCRGLKVDARADIYALGVLMYETLTGRLPFDGATPLDIWQAHAENPPAPPIDIAPGSVSPALNSIILRLLAKQPENRYQTATEFCVALENLTEDGHPRSTPAPIRIGHFSESSGGRAEETSSVFPPEISTEEERRREIEELRASLGLHIEEPASGDDASEQMSALVIDLGPTRAGTGEPKSLHRGETHSLPLRTGGGKVRVARNIEERKHVPPLAAPSARPVAARPVDNSSRVIEATVLTRRPKFGWVRIAIVAILLVAATILAIQFIP